jgi:flagellar biosynthetic protein FliQ
MEIHQAIDVGRDLVLTAILLSAPTVAVSLLVGLTISLFQTVTSLQEQTLTFAPRILAVGVVMVWSLPWCIRVSVAFSERMVMRMLEATQ